MKPGWRAKFSAKPVQFTTEGGFGELDGYHFDGGGGGLASPGLGDARFHKHNPGALGALQHRFQALAVIPTRNCRNTVLDGIGGIARLREISAGYAQDFFGAASADLIGRRLNIFADQTNGKARIRQS